MRALSAARLLGPLTSLAVACASPQPATPLPPPAPGAPPPAQTTSSMSPEAQLATQLNLLVDDAEKARQAGDIPGERRAYIEIAKLRPGYVEPHLALASLSEREHDEAGVERHLRNALRIAPDEERARFSLVASLLRQKRIKEATLEFGAKGGVGSVAAQQAADDRDPARVALARRLRGAIHLASGRYEEAAREFDALVKRNPSDPASRVGLAVVKATIGDPAGAEAELVAAARVDPKNAVVMYDLALVRLMQKRLEPALEAARSALKLDPRFAAAHNAAGAALLRLGKPEDAQREFAAALEADPRYAAAMSNLGVAAHARGEDSEARRRFEQAISLLPDAAALRFNLGLSLARLGQLELARDAFRRATELDPQSSDAMRNLRWMDAALRRTARVADLPARDPSVSVGELHP